MENNPADHDEAVSQFCSLTGLQPSEVRFTLKDTMHKVANSGRYRPRSTLPLMGGISRRQ